MNCLLLSQGTPISKGWCRVGRHSLPHTLDYPSPPPFSRATRGHVSQKSRGSRVCRRGGENPRSLVRSPERALCGPSAAFYGIISGVGWGGGHRCSWEPARHAAVTMRGYVAAQLHQAKGQEQGDRLAFTLSPHFVTFSPAVIPGKYRDRECFSNKPKSYLSQPRPWNSKSQKPIDKMELERCPAPTPRHCVW